LIHAGGFNLGSLMRRLIGVGTPRGLQGRGVAAFAALLTLIRTLWRRCRVIGRPYGSFTTLAAFDREPSASGESSCENWLSPRAVSPSGQETDNGPRTD